MNTLLNVYTIGRGARNISVKKCLFFFKPFAAKCQFYLGLSTVINTLYIFSHLLTSFIDLNNDLKVRQHAKTEKGMPFGYLSIVIK